jgi:hypothetical protein
MSGQIPGLRYGPSCAARVPAQRARVLCERGYALFGGSLLLEVSLAESSQKPGPGLGVRGPTARAAQER